MGHDSDESNRNERAGGEERPGAGSGDESRAEPGHSDEADKSEAEEEQEVDEVVEETFPASDPPAW